MESISASEAARALGSIRTERKAAASRENGKRGGRPAGVPMSEEHKAAIREARRRQEAEKRALSPLVETPGPKRGRGRPKKETTVENV